MDEQLKWHSRQKSTQQQSLQSILTLQSDTSLDQLERMVSVDAQKDVNLKSELNQFIGLLQKVKPNTNLKSELSMVISTEQEEYYSFQPKPCQREIMAEGFMRCYQEAQKHCDRLGQAQLEKMQMIYALQMQQIQEMETQIQSINEMLDKSCNFIRGLKNSLQEADKEIELLHTQQVDYQTQISKLISQLQTTQQELNQEKLCSAEVNNKNSHLKNLILLANKQFEQLQQKLLHTEEQLNLTVEQQTLQIKQLLQSNKSLRDALIIANIPLQQQPPTSQQSSQHSQNSQPEKSIQMPQQKASPSPRTSRNKNTTPKREWNKNTKTYR